MKGWLGKFRAERTKSPRCETSCFTKCLESTEDFYF